MHLTRSLAALAFLSATMPLNAIAADGDAKPSYPQRPITLVVGYPPGADADALARLLARYMGEVLGQRMIVDYKPGASGNIGAEAVARAKPDGYTIYLGVRPNTIHKTMYANMPYDFSQDLAPVGLVATMPYIMVASAHAPIGTVQELVRAAKSRPNALSCASDGIGSTAHLLCELLQQEVGINMLHVPYRGGAPAIADVMSGQTDMQIAAVAAALPHIQAGRLRPLAVMSPLRLPVLPDVPTIAEAGGPELELGAWYGLVVPAGTPSHVITTLNESINVALQHPELRSAMEKQAYAPPLQPNTPTAFKNMIAEETERWTTILQTRNIKPPQ